MADSCEKIMSDNADRIEALAALMQESFENGGALSEQTYATVSELIGKYASEIRCIFAARQK